ncbi:hypothetical protein C6P45_001019 [Maudiozyma exigua]|uniref:NADH:flavin oxidoreductase/NADH oxidase N-terminal domain-containing protein n=1 Tax=Maudiozyma exigua TaxID=34358 RepID=A0A9P7BCN7_MAUEX|nr:hypothetical protein C6P45_001019 [Kazachstania exigua]
MSFDESIKNVPFKDTNMFKPLVVGNTTLKHRVVMPPMARMRASFPDYVPNKEWAATYYEQRSRREGTMIITEGTHIAEEAGGYDHAPGIWSREQIEEWKRIIDGIHKNKSYVWMQLLSLGRQASIKSLARDGFPYVSASDNIYMSESIKEEAIKYNNLQHGLTKEEINNYIQFHVQAAKNTIEAGVDGVEIHAAHGYLLGQFQDPISNKRTDEYGGSIENRARLTLQIVDVISAMIGPERVGIRFSPYNIYGEMSGSRDPALLATFAYMIGQLEKRRKNNKGLAYIHLTEPMEDDNSVENTQLTFKHDYEEGTNDFIYSIWKGPIIRTGELAGNTEKVLEMLKDPRTLTGYGRYFISNPDLVDRLENGLPLNKYRKDLFYAMTSEGYIDYPTYSEVVANSYKK